MDMYSPLYCYAMQPGDLLAIRKTGIRVVRCLEGKVLVSLQGCTTDFSLAAGMEFAIDDNPLVLIESCGNTRIALSLPRRSSHRGWLLLGLLLFVIGIASSFAGVGMAGGSGAYAKTSTSWIACDPAERRARVQAWRVGKNMLLPDGTMATNRALSTYERECYEGF